MKIPSGVTPIETLENRLFLAAQPFLPRQFYPLNQTPRLVAVGDFNGDGRPDLVVPLPFSNVISILMNQGTGTFVRTPFIPFNTPRAVATGDFNGDGNVDIAVAGTDTNGANVVALYSGNGNGTFSTSPTRYGIASSGLSISADDVNGDGVLDLVVTTGRRLAVLINNGNGTFASPVYYNAGGNNTTADQPSFLQLADFNGDGLPDIAVTFENSGTVGILTNNQANPGTFSAPTTFVVPGNPLGLAAADFNHDGKIDLAVISSGFRIRGVNVLIGNGNGTFGPPVTYNGPYFADAIAAADFNRDGNPDLVIGSFQGPLEFLAGNGDGTFAAPVNVPGSLYVENIQVADFNADGLPDIVVPSGGIKVYLNSGIGDSNPTAGPTQQTIGSGSLRSYTFYSTDGTQTTVDLQGPGTATLAFSSSQTITLPTAPNGTLITARTLAGIVTTGTTLASTLSITTNLRSQVVFAGSITTDSPVGAINAPTTNVTGTVSLAQGARQVSLLSANSGTINISGGGPVSLLFGQVAGETITSAVAVKNIDVRNDAGMKLTAPSVGTFSVGRLLHDSTISLTAPWDANAVDLASLTTGRGMDNVILNSAGNVGTIAALEMSNDTIFAGVGTLAPGQVFPTAGDFTATAAITFVRLKVPVLLASFTNTVIAASRLNTLSLGSIQTQNNGTPFGVVANSIGTLTGTDRTHGRSFAFSNLTTQAAVDAAIAAKGLNLLDFSIRIV